MIGALPSCPKKSNTMLLSIPVDTDHFQISCSFSVEVCATPSSASKQCPQLTIFPVGRRDSGMYSCMATLLRHTAPPLSRRRQGKEQDWGEGSEAEKGREGPIIRYYPVHKVNLLVYGKHKSQFPPPLPTNYT